MFLVCTHIISIGTHTPIMVIFHEPCDSRIQQVESRSLLPNRRRRNTKKINRLRNTRQSSSPLLPQSRSRWLYKSAKSPRLLVVQPAVTQLQSSQLYVFCIRLYDKMAGVYIRRHGSVVVDSPSSSSAVHPRNQQTPAATAALRWRSDSYQVNGPCNNVDPLGNNPRTAEPGPVVQLTKLRHNCPAHDDDLQSPHHYQQGRLISIVYIIMY